jgi:hypothetical protein
MKYSQVACKLPSIQELKENFQRLGNLSEDDSSRYANVNLLIENTKKALDVFVQAKELIPNLDLYYSLVSMRNKNGSSFLGGIPDLSRCLGFEDGDIKQSYEKLWPRCGCCHNYMTFIGTFDLYPWLLPLHALTGSFATGIRKDEYDLFSSIGNVRMTQHSCLFGKINYHIFMCMSDTSEHISYPGYDAEILISKIYQDQSKNIPLEVDSSFVPSGAAIYDEEKTFMDYDLRVDFSFDWWDDPNKDSYEKIVQENPEIFDNRIYDYTFFGLAQSQQEPKHYRTTNRYCPQPDMTPLFNFDDGDRDFTYQIYGDMQQSEGFEIFCKIDGSCT